MHSAKWSALGQGHHAQWNSSATGACCNCRRPTHTAPQLGGKAALVAAAQGHTCQQVPLQGLHLQPFSWKPFQVLERAVVCCRGLQAMCELPNSSSDQLVTTPLLQSQQSLTRCSRIVQESKLKAVQQYRKPAPQPNRTELQAAAALRVAALHRHTKMQKWRDPLSF